MKYKKVHEIINDSCFGCVKWKNVKCECEIELCNGHIFIEETEDEK